MSLLRLLMVRPSCQASKFINLTPVALRTDPLKLLPQRHLSTSTDNDGELVYQGTISSMVRNVKFLSLSTSAIGIAFQPYLYLNSEQLGAAGIVAGGIFSFFIFVTPLLLHVITKKYVTEIYMKPEEEFTAYTWSFLLRKKKTKFTPNDVIQPGVPGPFSTILVKGKPLFMDPNYFTKPSAYRTMMGYNKPIDWSFPDDIHKEVKSGEDDINDRK